MTIRSGRRYYFVCKLLLLSVLLFSGSRVIVDIAVAQSTCDTCKTSVVAPCKDNCKRFSEKKQIENCVTICQDNRCIRPCTREITQASEIERREESLDTERAQKDMKSCKSCMTKQRRGYCRDTCKEMNPNSLSGCIGRCAKQQCANSCVLPVAPRERTLPRVPAMDCSTCRQTKNLRCSEDCGNPDAPGYTTCQVSCLEDACLEACNPALFE